MIRIIKPELVVRTCFDPMRRSGAVATVCKEHLLVSVHRDKDPSDAPIRRVPGNHRFAGLFSRRHRIRVGAQNGRSFFQQAKRALIVIWIGWSRAYRIANREIG